MNRSSLHLHAFLVANVFVFFGQIQGARSQTNPVVIGQLPVQGFAQGIAVSGHFVYLANGPEGLWIYDVSNPSQPVAVGHTNNSETFRAVGVAVAGNTAYLANSEDG